MPSTYCFVYGCPHTMKNTAGISYHLVPSRANRKKQWEEAVGHSLTHYARVCSAHFRALDYRASSGDRKRRRLKITAVPSVFELNLKRKRRRRGKAVSPGLARTVAPYRGAMMHYITPAEVGTKAEGDTFHDAPLDPMLGEPHEEHTYAYRWRAQRHASASTQTNLLASPEKRDFGIQTQLIMCHSKSTQCQCV
uniref:Protein containing THAP domain n=1 Tax=Rhipicephalus zambeziensis TaxID=60191 RepID=A0A224YVE2_9ACAR